MHADGRTAGSPPTGQGIAAEAAPTGHSSHAMTDIRPVMLSGWGIRLEPLAPAHAPELLQAASDGELWQLAYTSVPGPGLEAVHAYIAEALAGQAAGTMLPFAVCDADGVVLGCTRYYDIDTDVPNLAVGYTWYAARAQRTHVNSACKHLLLGHAFDTLGMRAVYLHTSHANLRSQAAIERLGARKDGVIRHHMRHRDGSLRDTVAYSIVAEEWPEIRTRLEGWLRER